MTNRTMNKGMLTAAALAAGLAGSQALAAEQKERLIPALEKIKTVEQKEKYDAKGEIVGVEDVERETYAPVIRTVNACVRDKAGAEHTVSMKFFLLVSADDLKIRIKIGKTTLSDIAPDLVRKFGKERIDQAVAFIGQAWTKTAATATKEEIDEPSPEFIKTLVQAATDIIAGKRVNDNEKSFEEKTRITIGAAQITYAGSAPGCKP